MRVSTAVSATLAGVLVLLGCWRIAVTYGVFSPTFDELFHLACGLEWWETHEYLVEPQHPPLSRVVAAAGPYFAGGRRTIMLDPAQQGWSVLEQLGVQRGLSLARRGNLLFFVLFCAVIWWWTRAVAGPGAALLAIFLALCLPPILGHAALATTDMALTATLPLALYATLSWWRRPGWIAAAWTGATLALMIGSKYTAFVFYPVALVAMVLLLWRTGLRPARCAGQWALAAAVCLILLFAVFQFRQKSMAETGFRAPSPGSLAARIYNTPLPLMQLAAGLRQVAEHSQGGHDAYLLGEYRTGGWWYFFPVVFALKTPLAFLALLALAAFWAIRSGRSMAGAPLLAGAAIILSLLPSTINIGIRHILPVYGLLIVPMAAFAWNWMKAGNWKTIVLAGLLAGLLAASVQASPDYLADFNSLAPRPLERVRVDSDLDWGQDMLRLAQRCRERNIQAVNVAPFGITDLELLGMPYAVEIKPGHPTSGWFAIGVTERIIRNAMTGGYRWLDAYQPVERIGKTIDLYHIDNASWPDLSAGLDHPVNYGLADFPARAPVAHIAAALQSSLLGGEWRTWNVYGFELAGQQGFFWLGHDRPGFRASLWATRPLRATIRVEAYPGPMRLDAVRHLRLAVNGDSGELIRFEGDAHLSWPAEFRPGFNVIQLLTPDTPQRTRLDSGEVRTLLVGIRRIDIEAR
jgi:4-amino-4-deoxy-L-arabinose transferase-like glycosyltransferase